MSLSVGLMVFFSLALVVWALWDLRRFSDFNHRREIAARIMAAWLLMGGAMANQNEQYREKIAGFGSEMKDGFNEFNGIGIAPTAHGISFENAGTEESEEADHSVSTTTRTAITNGGRVVSISSRSGSGGDDRATGPLSSGRSSSRWLPAGIGRRGGLPSGPRSVHGYLGTRLLGEDGASGLLQGCASGTSGGCSF